MNDIVRRSPTLKELIELGECAIIGGNHDISAGEVCFYQDTKLGFFKTAPDIFNFMKEIF